MGSLETPTYATVDDAVRGLFGGKAFIQNRELVSGGSINETSVLSLSNGFRLFLKEHPSPPKAFFEKEEGGLRALRLEGGPRVPETLALSSDPAKPFLLLEYIEPGKTDSRFSQNFGRSLARLHSQKKSFYGFDEDNFIGLSPQRNTQETSWPRFFGKHRLEFQGNLVKKNRMADSNFLEQLDRLIQKLDALLPSANDFPSLVHGDLWSGNVLADEHGAAVLVDPAVYYGHRETDLAMLELFGNPGKDFFSAYGDIIPIEPGYSDRLEIYNLYHLLNHLNLFGTGYLANCQKTLARFS